MPAVKITKVMGTSEESWEDAAQQAIDRASQTIDDISGIKVKDWTANVEDDQITNYKTTVEISFPVHDQ